MLYLLITLYLFQAQENPHYEGWLIIQADAGDCPDAYENLGAMAWLNWQDHGADGYVYFDDGTIAKVEGDSLTFPSAVAAEAETYKLEWLKDGGGFKIKLIPEHQGKDPCAWKQAFLRLKPTETPGPSQQEWQNEYQAIAIMTEVAADLEQGLTTNAFTRLRQALVLSPYNEDIHESIAWLVRKEDPEPLVASLMVEAKKAAEAHQLDLTYAWKAPVVLALNFVGNRAFENKDYEKSLETYQQALELIPNHPLTLANAGYACDWLGRDDEALALFQKAVTAAATAGQSRFRAKARSLRAISANHDAISSFLEITPDWAKAITRGASELPSTPAMAEAREKWVGLTHQVLSSLRNGQSTKGLVLAVEALTLAEKQFGGTHPDYFTSLNNLALLYHRNGAYDQAQTLYERALQLCRDVLGERHPHTLRSINNLAALYESQGAYDQAQPLYEQALQLCRDVLGERHPDTLRSMNGLAVLNESQGAYDQAQPLLEQALQLKRDVLGERHPDTLSSMNNLALLYKSLGAYDQAQSLFEQALQLKRDVLGARHPDTLTSMNNLAFLYQSQGTYDQAQPLYEQVLQLRRDVLGERHPHTLISITNLATLYESQGAYDQAQPLYEQTLQLSRDVLGERHRHTLSSINNLALLYKRQGAYDQAQPLYEQALQLSRDVLGERHPDTLNSIRNLALLYLGIGDKEQGEILLHQYLVAANQFISQLNGFSAPLRRSFIGREDAFKNTYLSALTQSVTRDAPLDLLAFSLQRKGLLYNLDSQEIHQDQEQDRLQRLRRELARGVSSGVPTGSQSEMQQLEASLGQNQHLETQIDPFQLFAAMPASSCLIDLHVFFNFNFKTMIWSLEILALVIDPQSQEAVRVVMLGSLQALEDDLMPFLTSVTSPCNRSLSQKSARALYQKLWQPLAPYLTDKETVYLSADGILNRLPFGALIDEKGCWLAEKHTLHLLISPRDLLKTHSGNANAPALIYAPDYDALPLDPDPQTLPATERFFNLLPGALAEGQMLTTAFSRAGKPVQELTAAAATEAAVSALQAPAILHIASHGIYLNGEKSLGPTRSGKDSAGLQRELISGDDKAPPPSVDDWPYLNAAIALAGANQAARGITAADATDGLLTGLEVLSMNLRGTELVVLSACQTGLGDITPGEGAYSLNRAFLEAGARAVLSSLWSVDDSATAAFMTRFYERYLAGEPAVDALHAVQQEFIQSEAWSDPYYWAPFVLVGGPKTTSDAYESQSSKLP